jgi:hypothetical protein
MKKLSVLFAAVGLVVLAGRGTMADTSNSTDSLFIVSENVISDIQGNIIEKNIPIYKVSPSINSLWGMTISFKKRTRDDIVANTLDVAYVGDKWRFFDIVQIKIDDTLFTITDDDPSREVSGRYVAELVRVLLPNDAIDLLKSCETIMVQVNGKTRGEPIMIANNGIGAVNIFFQND